MKKRLKAWFEDIGIRRNIERHNFLIHRINRELVSSLPYKGRVIDLGCGTASYKDDILKIADEYIGVDWKNSMHDQSNVDIFADLIRELPFDDNYTDTVVSFQVLEHLPEPDFFLSECSRILRSGGTLFLTVPFMWQIHEEPHDYFRYTRYGLDYLLKKNGFTDIQIKEETGFWQMWLLRFNYHTASFACGYFRYFWYVVWWLTQVIAPVMDKIDPNSGGIHTAIYSVQARKA